MALPVEPPSEEEAQAAERQQQGGSSSSARPPNTRVVLDWTQQREGCLRAEMEKIVSSIAPGLLPARKEQMLLALRATVVNNTAPIPTPPTTKPPPPGLVGAESHEGMQQVLQPSPEEVAFLENPAMGKVFAENPSMAQVMEANWREILEHRDAMDMDSWTPLREGLNEADGGWDRE